MPIRPIDMQTILPTAQRHHNAKEVIVHKDQNAHQNTQMREEQRIEHEQHKVQKTDTKDSIILHKDKDEQKNKKKNKDKRNLFSKNSDDREEVSDSSKDDTQKRIRHIDIRI